MPDTSSFEVSAARRIGDRERNNQQGGVAGLGHDGSTERPPLKLECGAAFVVAAAINIVVNDGEGKACGIRG